MEKCFESWFNRQHTDWQVPNSNSLSAPFDLGQQNTVPPYVNACINMLSPNRMVSKPIEPRNWFYCLPCFRKAFGPVLNSVPKEKLPACLNEIYKGDGASNAVQKRFLVFDQSGDQTTLFFSSGVRAPAQYFPSWSPKPHCAFELQKEELGIKRDAIHSAQPFSIDEYNNQENDKDDVRSEMHEDTEELNALLYSDDDAIDYAEDEEETSTGHSPSTMTGYDKQEWAEESGEEVASSAGPAAKRQKLVNGGYDRVPSSLIEFSCRGGRNQNQVFAESGSLSGNKRSRKEKLGETISILQKLIPGVKKGKDAIVVLDEAIHYLRSLKVKAQALGLNSL